MDEKQCRRFPFSVSLEGRPEIVVLARDIADATKIAAVKWGISWKNNACNMRAFQISKKAVKQT